MAKRFGGKFSPHSEPAPHTSDIPKERLPRIEHPYEGRPFWLAICALPFLFGAFGDGPLALAQGVGAFALCVGAAVLLREGLRAQAAFDARSKAHRPALPRKILGAVGFGCAMMIGSADASGGVWTPLGTGLIAGALALVGFGLDPLRSKGMGDSDRLQQSRVAAAVEIGEAHLVQMQRAIARTNTPQLETRIEVFTGHARALFRVVEEDPEDLRSARRYMTLYLEGAKDATEKFADHYSQTRDARVRAQYEALLDDLQTNFTAQSQRLLAHGREGLDIEIEVLRERLAREGVAPAPN
ncbi:hypothetical protein ERN12_06595 [Rhodobacteraceae bacterium]|nr:hypothetical protein ERN12_06595 [Paracoccaceae bacterium]